MKLLTEFQKFEIMNILHSKRDGLMKFIEFKVYLYINVTKGIYECVLFFSSIFDCFLKQYS